MPILDNNAKAHPFKIRVEKVPFERRTLMPDGRAIINRRPAVTMRQPKIQTNPARAIKTKKTKATAAPEPKYTIGSEDWKVWEPIFLHARDKLGVEFGSKTQLELHMDADKRYDGYKHWMCSLRPRGSGALNIKFSLQSSDRMQRFRLLAAMYVKDGQARLVTRTSIAHNARLDCTPWTRFSVPDCAVQPCCDALCRDVPREGEISLYEQGLLVAKRDLELEELRARMDKRTGAAEEAQRQQAKTARGLKRKVEDLERANRRLAERCAELAAEKGIGPEPFSVDENETGELEAMASPGPESEARGATGSGRKRARSDDGDDERVERKKALDAKRRRSA